MATPQLSRSPIFYKSAAALGEKFTYEIFIYTGLYTTNKPASATYTITKDRIQDVVEVGTTTSTTASKLVDSVKQFSSTVEVGDLVYNTTDNTIALVSAVDSNTTLSLDTDIIVSGEGYKIFSKTSASIEIAEIIRDYFKTEYYNFATDAVWVEITTSIQVTSGTVTTVTANKLVDSTQTFIRKLLPSSTTVTINNTTDSTSATVSAVDNDTTLSISSDIFPDTGDAYTITVPASATNNTPWLVLDGYGLFKEGLNPGDSVVSERQALISNSTMYFIPGKDIIIPIYAPLQSTLTFSVGGNVANVFWNAEDEFWDSYEVGWGNIISDIKVKDGVVVDSGTADGTSTYKLVDSSQNFTSTVKVGNIVYNTTDESFANITAVDSDTQLTLDSDIMAAGEDYEIQNASSNDKIQYVVISQTADFTGGTVTITDGLGLSLTQTIELKELCDIKYTPYRVIFYNRYGVLQDIIFNKKSSVSMETTSDKFKRSTVNFNLSNFTYDTYKAQKQRIDIQGNESLILNTDFLSEDINDPIKELLLSQQIWVDKGIGNTNSTIFPVVIKSSSIEEKTGVNNKLINYTIEFELAFDEIQNIR